MRAKRECEKAVRTTISMPPELWKAATEAQRKKRFSTFSDLIQDLIRQTQRPVARAASYAR